MVRREKPQNRKYDLVWRDGDIFSIGVDTDMYKAAFGAQIREHQNIPILRLEDVLDNLTDTLEDQHEPARYDCQDFMDFLALGMPSSDESDTELATERFSIPMDCQRPTYAFVGNGVDLKQCVLDTATSLPFCVWVVCDLQPCQMFALQEPCNGECKHVRLEVMGISSLQRALPYTMIIQSISYSMLLDDQTAVGARAEPSLEPFSGCERNNGCQHTGVEGISSPEACCVRPVCLRAWLDDDVVEGEAVASMEDGYSYDSSISADSALDDDGEDRDDGDDERALNLWQAVINGSDIPARIELDALVSYIKVVDEYNLGELYISQGLDWADALLPTLSTSFNEDAIAWLWILWRLHMPTEFKRLSDIIAQQATSRIGPEHNGYGVEIPETIIDAIERRRVYALSQIRDCIHLNIRYFQDEYADAFQQSFTPLHQALRVMSSAVTVGYLTLETQRHLPDAQEGGNPNFCGVSFEDAAKWIRSILDLGDWLIRTVPPARRMPQLLADLSTFVPNLGVVVHESGISIGLSLNVHKDLTNLIARLEAREWGLDLDSYM